MEQKEKRSFFSRIFTLETMLVLVAVFFLASGIRTKDVTQTFWSFMIGGGAVALHFVRRKDWKKHWEEQESMRQANEEARRRQKEKGQ